LSVEKIRAKKAPLWGFLLGDVD